MISRSSLRRWSAVLALIALLGPVVKATIPSSIVILNNATYFDETSAGVAPTYNDFELTVLGLSGAVSFTDPNGTSHAASDMYTYGHYNNGFLGAPSAFGSGLYTINIGSTSVSTLGMSTTIPTFNRPSAASLSGGQWSGTSDNYLINASSAFSLTTNSIGLSSGQQGLILVQIFDNTLGTMAAESDTFGNYSPTTAALSVPAFSLTSGHDYQVVITFDAFVDGTSNGPDTTSIPGTFAASAFARVSSFNLVVSAVPEPATTAFILGMAALGGVVMFRRRKPVVV